MTDSTQTDGAAAGRPRLSQDFAAGLFLIAISLFAVWQGYKLPLGTLRSMGPGMLPMSLAAILAAGGVALCVTALLDKEGTALESWSLRGLFFVVGSVCLFAFLIQSVGLIVAGPVSMMFCSLAGDEFRWKEALIFSVSLTVVCILMFKTLLGLPIPVATFW